MWRVTSYCLEVGAASCGCTLSISIRALTTWRCPFTTNLYRHTHCRTPATRCQVSWVDGTAFFSADFSPNYFSDSKMMLLWGGTAFMATANPAFIAGDAVTAGDWLNGFAYQLFPHYVTIVDEDGCNSLFVQFPRVYRLAQLLEAVNVVGEVVIRAVVTPQACKLVSNAGCPS